MDGESQQIEKAALAAKVVIDYFFAQLNGVGITTQPVKKADLPEGFRG